MKKYMTAGVILTIFAGIAFFHTQLKSLIIPEKPVSKSISLSVYKSADYLSAAYNNASAKLQITVTKVKGKTQTIVWDKIFNAMQLKEYPLLQNALSQKIIINNVFDNKEHLEVNYTLTYNSNGSKLEMSNGILVSKGNSGGMLKIGI